MFDEEETLCLDHIDDANSRARLSVGVPFVILVIISVICLICSIIGIANAMGEVSFEAELEVVPGTLKSTLRS